MTLDTALSALDESKARWRTLRARGREWRHEPRLTEAFLRATPSDAVTVTASFVGPPVQDEREERWSIWIERPRRVRAEFVVGAETVAVVFHDDTWWSWAPALGARTNGGRRDHGHGTGPVEALIETAALLPVLRFEAAGAGRWLDRPVAHLRAFPPTPVRLEHAEVLHRLGSGADEYRLTVDLERGILLRVEARSEGRPFQIVEATQIAFDEDLPASTFELDLPAGVTFEEGLP